MDIAALNTKLIEDRLGFMNLGIVKLKALREMPKEKFLTDDYPAIAESYLRRALEALFDIGRHISARTAGKGFVECKEVGKALGEQGVIKKELADKLVLIAGYRNRLVHFYHEISNEELFKILTEALSDIEEFTRQIRNFLAALPSNLRSPG